MLHRRAPLTLLRVDQGAAAREQDADGDARVPVDLVALGAATRARIVDAAFRLLLEVGYHGTTTTLVQKTAGVSRGSLLNQFPTRADLMTAVHDHIIETRSQAYTARMEGVTDDRRRYEMLVEVLWEEMRKPGGVARLEIMVAAASDPDLLQRLRPAVMRQDAIYRDLIWRLAQRLGVSDRGEVDDAVTAYSAALRGLTIDLLFPRPGVDVDGVAAGIRRDHLRRLDAMLAGSSPAIDG